MNKTFQIFFGIRSALESIYNVIKLLQGEFIDCFTYVAKMFSCILCYDIHTRIEEISSLSFVRLPFSSVFFLFGIADESCMVVYCTLNRSVYEITNVR